MNKQAVCQSDPNKHRWFSYDLNDIEYAKKNCLGCSLIQQCYIAYERNREPDDVRLFVLFGTSEFERLWENNVGEV